jgi:hypothetical protein
MENYELVSPSRQCCCTQLGFGQGCLSKEQRDSTGASLILSWPGSSSFLPVPLTEISSKGWRFCDASDINKNATEELKILSQKASMNVFDTLTVAGRCLVA